MAPSQLQIKINALNRLMKESTLYEKEADEMRTKIEKLKSDGGDEYEIKNAVSILVILG